MPQHRQRNPQQLTRTAAVPVLVALAQLLARRAASAAVGGARRGKRGALQATDEVDRARPRPKASGR